PFWKPPTQRASPWADPSRINPITGIAGCARAASGQAAAEPAIPLMRSRRRIACPGAQDYANSPDYIRDLPLAKWGPEAWLHGSKLERRMAAMGHKRTSGGGAKNVIISTPHRRGRVGWTHKSHPAALPHSR